MAKEASIVYDRNNQLTIMGEKAELSLPNNFSVTGTVILIDTRQITIKRDGDGIPFGRPPADVKMLY